MRKIKVAGLDPSLTHTGIVKGFYDLDTGEFTASYVTIVVTEPAKGKTVRKNSDDLQRCNIVARALYEHLSDCDVVFSEVPTGAQSSRAAFSFGMVIGILATFFARPENQSAFVQMLPQAVKLAVPGGSKTTSKEEIVEWAVEKWPNVGWVKGGKASKYRIDGQGYTADNEHMADACAVVNAGVIDTEFRNLLAAFRFRSA